MILIGRPHWGGIGQGKVGTPKADYVSVTVIKEEWVSKNFADVIQGGTYFILQRSILLRYFLGPPYLFYTAVSEINIFTAR